MRIPTHRGTEDTEGTRHGWRRPEGAGARAERRRDRTRVRFVPARADRRRARSEPRVARPPVVGSPRLRVSAVRDPWQSRRCGTGVGYQPDLSGLSASVCR